MIFDAPPKRSDAEARNWFLRLTEAEPTADELDAWKAWLSQGGNASAFDRVAALWSLTEAVDQAAPSPAELARDRYCGSVSVRAWRRRKAAARVLTRAMAACLCAAALGAGWFVWDKAGTAPVEQITTARAEHASRSLTDGSRIRLAADTDIEIKYRRGRRDLVLNRGEAMFDVAKDVHRPFIVATPMLQVKAEGTSFDVDTQADRTTVRVSEGVVGVTPRARPGGGVGQAIRVSARQKLVIANGEVRLVAFGPSDSFEPDWLDWRREYRNEPLRAVIADVNRYSKLPIDLQDETIGDRQYTGSVQLKEIDSWLLGVAKAFQLSLSVGDKSVSLRKKESISVPQSSLRAS